MHYIFRLPTAVVIAILVGLCIIGAALGARPDNADEKLSIWFQSLRQPGSGISCCGIADGHLVDYRITGDHYEVWYDKTWMPIPQPVVIRTNNPTGTGVVFIGAEGQIYCFVPGTDA